MRLAAIVASLFAVVPLAFGRSEYLQKPTAICDIYREGVVSATFVFIESEHYTSMLGEVEYGLNDTAGWPYHIHESPVSHGDYETCLSAGEHLDPYKVGATAVCTPDDVTKCQVGDLAGRYGKLVPNSEGVVKPFAISDKQLHLENDHDLSIIGRSIVIHRPNGTRFACCNIYSSDTVINRHYKRHNRRHFKH